ncbi:MAG: ribulose-phosphate 3-epimerase [Candidatus Bipolaricaulota bacterium]|nr:ribulose-phosphate 3-epimerase [Candidatus Bipolaricaulota bacterium]MBS3791897.1 ribulose-phosphate 3-epimerase [Candidatus Bipolaricaulota bacterium]
MSEIVFAPSILSADFGRLVQEIESVEEVADSIHVDVMDGHFVPNITIGPLVSNSLKRSNRVNTPLSIHLMIDDPWKYGPEFEVDSEDMILFHREATDRPFELFDRLRGLGCKVGISQKPASPVDEIFPMLEELDEVLVMGVEPGFGGQEFNPEAIERIEALERRIRESSHDTVISVDGGMSPSTIGPVVRAGADKIVAGSAIFGKEDRVQAVRDMEDALP